MRGASRETAPKLASVRSLSQAKSVARTSAHVPAMLTMMSVFLHAVMKVGSSDEQPERSQNRRAVDDERPLEHRADRIDDQHHEGERQGPPEHAEEIEPARPGCERPHQSKARCSLIAPSERPRPGEVPARAPSGSGPRRPRSARRPGTRIGSRRDAAGARWTPSGRRRRRAGLPAFRAHRPELTRPAQRTRRRARSQPRSRSRRHSCGDEELELALEVEPVDTGVRAAGDADARLERTLEAREVGVAQLRGVVPLKGAAVQGVRLETGEGRDVPGAALGHLLDAFRRRARPRARSSRRLRGSPRAGPAHRSHDTRPVSPQACASSTIATSSSSVSRR